MVSVVNTENIIAFVKQSLGCNCPDEVFSHIECQSDIPCSGILLDMRINVGNRLLIYIVTVNDPDFLRRMLPALVTAGKKERDGAGFNRFRLVLAADDVSKIKKEAEKIFNSLNEDEKIYLHTLSKKSIPQCPTG
jgi:hypothetical protein